MHVKSKCLQVAIFGLPLIAIVVLLVGGHAYWRTTEVNRKTRVALSSTDSEVVCACIYNLKPDEIHFRSFRTEIKNKIAGFLGTNDLAILRAAIIASDSARMGIVDDRDGMEAVRAAIGRYNSTQEREKILLEKRGDGKYIVMIQIYSGMYE